MIGKRHPKRAAAPSVDATAEQPDQPYRPPMGLDRPTDDEELSRVVLNQKPPEPRRRRKRQRLGTLARGFAVAGSLVAAIAVAVLSVSYRVAQSRFGVDLWQVARPVDDPALRELVSLFDVGTMGALASLTLLAPGLVLGVLSVRGTSESSRGRAAITLAIATPTVLGAVLFLATA